MTTLFLVRHGESEWNRLGRIQGQVDSPLTDTGIAQAHAIGAYLAPILNGTGFHLYTSPLGRARQTTEIVGRYVGCNAGRVVVDERINDFDLGEISGYPGWDKVAADHPELARLRLQDPHRFHPNGGESGAQVSSRVSEFLDDLDRQSTPALIVSHGVINKFIRSVRRNLQGAQIIALGESQRTVYRLEGRVETALELGAEEEVKG